MEKYSHNRSAFTLVELLVVIGVISVLMAIALPATVLARGLAQRMACRNNLRSAGWAFHMYLDDYHDIMPPATPLPSTHYNKPAITVFLKTYLRDLSVLKCPADKGILYPDCNNPSQCRSYFDVEGSSYEYNASLGGVPISASRAARRGNQLANIPVMYDYQPFHGPAGVPNSVSYLYADYHVGNLTMQ